MVKIIKSPYVPRPIQARLHSSLSRFSVLVCHRRFGKQNDIESLIPIAAGGYKRLGDIVAGDIILDNFGNPTTVLQAHDINMSPESYEVVLDNGDVVKACRDHQWYVEPSISEVGVRSNRASWKCGKVVSTVELQSMISEASWFIPCTEPVKYKEADLSIDPYSLGLWLGDGASNEFLICGIDSEIHTYLKHNNLKTSYREKPTANYTRVLGHTKLLRNLKLLKNKHIPTSYKFSSIEQRIALIQGMMDTDGSQGITTEGNSSSSKFYNSNLQLCKDFKEVLQSLGVKASLVSYDRGSKGVEHLVIFSSWFCPFRLERKAIRHKERTLKAARYKVVAVNKIESVPMRCLTVDSEMHLFLITENYIPTHNTVFAINHIIQKLLQNTLKRPQYAYIAPEKSQARKIAWDYLKEYTRFIPGVQFFEAELKVEIPLANDTKGVIYLEGAENPDRLRGMYFDGVILDEVAQMPRSIWTEIVRPAVSDRTGWALFIGTPKGKNYFKELYEYSNNPEMKEMGWSSFMYKASETGVLPADELKSLRMEMTDEEYDQEYECNFDAAIPGSYYGKSLATLRKRNHIGIFNWNPKLPVITAWDIGMNDKTVVWFAQLDNNEVILIDYYENSDEILSHYINIIKSKPYVYDYHIMPHDVTQRSYTTGATRLSELEQMGLKCRVAKRTTVLDGINSARNMLLRCKFNAIKCSKGLDALAFYHSQYNDKNDVQQLVPVHDWSSHAADAFRYLATGMTGRSRPMSEYAEADYDYFNTRQYSYKPHDPFEDS